MFFAFTSPHSCYHENFNTINSILKACFYCVILTQSLNTFHFTLAIVVAQNRLHALRVCFPETVSCNLAVAKN